MLRFTSILPALVLITSTAAFADATAAPPGNPAAVAVVVRIARPPAISHERVLQVMTQTWADYQNVPGLIHKDFTISDDDAFGGIYLFRDRASAERHFSPAWFASVKQAFGVDANVMYFSSPIQIDGKNSQG